MRMLKMEKMASPRNLLQEDKINQDGQYVHVHWKVETTKLMRTRSHLVEWIRKRRVMMLILLYLVIAGQL